MSCTTPLWGVELAGLLAGGVRKLADEILVGSAEQVRELEILIQKPVLVEVADEPPQLLVGNFGFADLAGEIDVTQDARQGLMVRVFQASQSLVQLVGDI